MLAPLGGAEALRDDPNDFRKAVNRLWGRARVAGRGHIPKDGVSMGKDGVVSIGDSIEEVVAATEIRGVSTADVVVEYLDPDPERLILLSAVGVTWHVSRTNGQYSITKTQAERLRVGA